AGYAARRCFLRSATAGGPDQKAAWFRTLAPDEGSHRCSETPHAQTRAPGAVCAGCAYASPSSDRTVDPAAPLPATLLAREASQTEIASMRETRAAVG